MASVAYLLAERAKVARLGDAGLYRAITADLTRLGYVDETPRPEAAPVERVETPTGMETTAVRAPERAVPKGGRPPMPRCKHGKIDDGRCPRCKTP
jgi:hypothetical protein